jgi:UDP-N-acetylmuramate--alanine ligase
VGPASRPRVQDRRIVTYGFSAQADIRGENVQPVPGGNMFDVQIRERDGAVRRIDGINMPMPGRHNVLNAMAAIGVALQMGIPDSIIQSGFASFGGVKRRFTKVGEIVVDGGNAIVIDDYGHHPVEIRAVLAAAREGARGRVIAVVQPHRFTRLRDLMDDFQQAFNDADMVYVAPVYTAGEQPIEGVDADALVAGLKRRGHRAAQTIADAEALTAALAADLKADDMIVCLGAGDITKWAAGLAVGIDAERKEPA